MPWAWVENQMDPEPISSLPSALQLSTLHWDQLHIEDLRNWHLWVKKDWPKCGFQDSGCTSEPLLWAFLGPHGTRPQEWQTGGTLTPLSGHVPSSGLLGPLLTFGLEPHLSLHHCLPICFNHGFTELFMAPEDGGGSSLLCTHPVCPHPFLSVCIPHPAVSKKCWWKKISCHIQLC